MSKKRKILVADDERIMRELLESMLNHAGYEVVFAEDGLVAVEKAVTEKPDLVLLDGLMPKLHGFLACKAIKNFDSPPKVLILTGVYTKPTYRWEVECQYSADGLLSKPIDRNRLLASIEKLLADSDKDQRFTKSAAPEESERREARSYAHHSSQAKQLKTIVSICSHCKRVRNDDDSWRQVGRHIDARTKVQFSHGICPQCYETIVQPELNRLAL